MLSVESNWTVFERTPVVFDHGPILVKEHKHPLLLQERRPRLAEESLIEMAVQEERVLQDRKSTERVNIS